MTLSSDSYAAITAATAPAFSRDGKTLFHLRGSGLSQIWALDIATGADRQLTQHDENVALIRRSPKDDRLIYGMDRGGDEYQQLWLLDPTTSESRPLTGNLGVIHEWGGWSPDATRIAYAANERDVAHFDVYLQDVASGERQCVFHGTNIVTVSGFSPDGGRLIVLHDRGYGDMSLLVLDLASGVARQLGDICNWQSVRWSRDGNSLLALTDSGSDFLRLCRLDATSGAASVIYQAPGRDVETWALSPDERLLATVENDRGYGILRIGPAGTDRPAVSGLPRGIAGELAWSPDSATLAFSAAAPDRPSSLWLWREGSAQPLWQPPLEVAASDYELVAWDSFDGTRIEGWLALPRTAKPAAGYPAVVWVHGGPVFQTRPSFRPDTQMLLAHGFAVLLPNVRGSSGYGRAYTASDDKEKRLDSVTDLAHSRQWLAAHPAIDAERIGIMGQSYGGFMVMSAITEHPELWRAAVNYYGIADFTTLLANTGPWRSNHRAAEYGNDPELFGRISPIHRIDRVRAPVLIAHGHRDPRVPFGESEQFVTALAERQKKVAFETFDYAGHGFIRPEDKRRIYRAVAEFFREHL